MLATKNFFSLSDCACQKYGFPSVTRKPVSPAHSLCCGFTPRPVKDSMWVRSSRFHVLPMEKVPLGFSLALCMRTRPERRTEMMITRGFSELRVRASGGGGPAGWLEYSVTRTCVMYVSCTTRTRERVVSARFSRFTAIGLWRRRRLGLTEDLHPPSGSFLLKQVSMMRRFSSSKRIALLGAAPGPASFARSI